MEAIVRENARRGSGDANFTGTSIEKIACAIGPGVAEPGGRLITIAGRRFERGSDLLRAADTPPGVTRRFETAAPTALAAIQALFGGARLTLNSPLSLPH
jgi:hypothetical protein